MITVKVDDAVKCNGRWSLFLSFPYDNDIINAVRDFPSRYWHKDSKQWELPLDRLGQLLEKLPNEEFDISGQYVDMTPKEVKIPDGFEFKTKPFQHQLEGLEYGLKYDRWLLGDEMGLGKTKQAIDIAIAKKLEKGYKHCLIICGVNGLKWNWLNEISIHSNETGYILGTRGKKIGTNADKFEDIVNLENNDSYFIITNVESLREETISKGLATMCKNGVIGMVVADEIHKMKNPSSQQGKGFLKVQADTMIAMTGTPLMNNPMDLYIILRWLGYEKHAFYSFKQHYCVMGGYGGYEIIGYRNLDELREQLESIMLRRLKKDVLDLPDKTYIDEYVEMTPKQAQIYREVTMDIKSHIDEISISPNPLAELIRMRQATGYTGILSSKIQESAKMDRMKELIDDALANNKQVVVFSNWTQITDAIIEKLDGYKYGLITGQTPDKSRQDMVEKFQDGKYKIMIGTIGAMGTGITLTAGTVEIFMDEPWNKALYEQAVDRCYRVGTTENITIYTLMAKGTIDERIHDLVYKKGQMSDALVDGKIQMDKREVLDFLLD